MDCKFSKEKKRKRKLANIPGTTYLSSLLVVMVLFTPDYSLTLFKFLADTFFAPKQEMVASLDIATYDVYFDSSVIGQDKIEEALSNQKKSSHQILHLFTHGRPGELYINNQWMNHQDIVNWLSNKKLLTLKNHLNIYGCEFAKGKKGLEAVSYLEAALGISVAASDDITGKNGDWDLEVGLPLEVVFVKSYQYNFQDSDGDSIPDSNDLDDDNDGIPDLIESDLTSVCSSNSIGGALFPAYDYTNCSSISGGTLFSNIGTFAGTAIDMMPS